MTAVDDRRLTLAVPPRVRFTARPTPRSGWLLWDLACAGREPAEVLDPLDREDLVWGLHGRGYTDTEIAVHTRMSTYTATRIRSRLGLPANPGRAA